MIGNSWLGSTQYFAGMAQPPSLKALAPWEGFADNYREVVRRGGIPWTPFLRWVLLGIPGKLHLESPLNSLGRGRQEDIATMAEEHEFFDAYWQTKRVEFSKIKVPTYMLASYSSMLHTVGSIRAFREINTDQKWLRIHPHQEWYEDYLHSSVQDLDRFFERYLKGVENGWEATPRVRVSMLRFGENVRHQFEV